MDILKRLGEAVIAGKIGEIEDLTREAIDNNYEPLQIINQGLLPGMEVVGTCFKAEEMYIPEVLLSAETMKKAVNLLKPLLVSGTFGQAGKVVIGTVKSDYHDVGKNIVIMLMEAAGYEVIDLGMDVAELSFIETVAEQKPDVIGMSAMLTTTMMEMQKVIDLLKERHLRDKVKVIIGGAPVNQLFNDQIGADGYGENAATAVDLLKRLVRH
ncbi:MAG: corrinoid protein [Desulfobaccales bacterium]